jgi:integrase
MLLMIDSKHRRLTVSKRIFEESQNRLLTQAWRAKRPDPIHCNPTHVGASKGVSRNDKYDAPMKYALTDTTVKKAKAKAKPYKIADGGGLYLLVSATGAKLWRYKYRIGGKEGTFAIGEYPAIGLAKARTEHATSRDLVDHGVHPLHNRKAEELKQIADAGNTFKTIANNWIEKNKKRWTPSYLRQVERFMAADVFPQIGTLPIKQVTAAHVLKIMKQAEGRGAETIAILIRQWCSAVFRYAAANLQADADPAVALKGAVARPKVRHNAALSAKEIPALMTALGKFGGYRTTSIAVELLLLTFVRTVELRKAKWSEFDLEAALWRIPAERMKMKTEHLVPLSSQAVALVKELNEWTGGRNYLFPNYRTPKDCMTATTVNRALDRMGYRGKFSAHGFRSTASTLLHEQGYRPEVIERQLAHAERNKVKAAYNHAEYLKERTVMMQHWADYIDALCTGAKVYNIKVAS